ncbi:LysR family transcriptional regulator [Pseudomonas sp. LRF_L74]|uniref:LysR family transcriptional regulator n=1 Tax=Pseudomonas sp. LRF_L74 TaxID=3369422 RepID=UPI003F60EED6
MDTLFNMRAFVCVAETGSFTAAAQRLDLTTSYVSRAVASLESHLRTRLLQRTTRRVALTEAGQRYLARCEQILGYIEEAEAEASQAHARPVGNLKVHAVTGIGQHYLIKAIAAYRGMHPDVSFDMTLANRTPDILDEGYDISVVIAEELPDSGFISQRLGSTYSVLCAAPDYLAQHGEPLRPGDLGQHQCLRLVNPVMALDHWQFKGPNGQEFVDVPQTPFQVNTADAMTEALKAGIGIGVLPIYSAAAGLRDGSLVRVLPEYNLFPLGIFALYPSRQFLDAKIRTWVEFLRDFLPARLAADEACIAPLANKKFPGEFFNAACASPQGDAQGFAP